LSEFLSQSGAILKELKFKIDSIQVDHIRPISNRHRLVTIKESFNRANTVLKRILAISSDLTNNDFSTAQKEKSLAPHFQDLIEEFSRESTNRETNLVSGEASQAQTTNDLLVIHQELQNIFVLITSSEELADYLQSGLKPPVFPVSK